MAIFKRVAGVVLAVLFNIGVAILGGIAILLGKWPQGQRILQAATDRLVRRLLALPNKSPFFS